VDRLAIGQILVRAIAFYALRHLDASVITVTFPVASVQTGEMHGVWRTIVANGVRANLARARIWFRRIKTRRRLHELDARELDDIGVTKGERQRECANWFWQP
jgi:uncharacterized protein YjiS (DUF1127 family)